MKPVGRYLESAHCNRNLCPGVQGIVGKQWTIWALLRAGGTTLMDSTKIKWAVGLAVGVLLLGGGGFLAYSAFGNSTPPPDPEPPPAFAPSPDPRPPCPPSTMD